MDDMNVINYQTDLLARLRQFWRDPSPDVLSGRIPRRIAGSPYDQHIPPGTANPYWQIIRQMPIADHPLALMGRANTLQVSDMVLAHDRAEIFGDRGELCLYYTFSICSPEDIRWVSSILEGRGVIEIGAGGGYWAWQAQQHGINWIATDPGIPGKQHQWARTPWATVGQGDASLAAAHPDRVLFMSWPSPSDKGGQFAAEALAGYMKAGGDTLIYSADTGVCADDAFYTMLHDDWIEVETAPHHVSWWMTNDRLSLFQRKDDDTDQLARLAAQRGYALMA